MTQKWIYIGTIFAFFVLTFIACNSEAEKSLQVDFTNAVPGEVPENWKIAETSGKGTPAQWMVMKEAGNRIFGVTKTVNTGQTYNLAIYQEFVGADLEISTKVKSIRGEEDQGGGPIWRVQDENNYYIARWNPLEDNFRVYYVKEGKRTQIGAKDIEVDPEQWHEIKIVMNGNTIEAYLDGEKHIEVEDDTFTSSGKVGLWTKADAATAFDDFTVKGS